MLKRFLTFQSIRHITPSNKAEEHIVVAHLGIVTATKIGKLGCETIQETKQVI